MAWLLKRRLLQELLKVSKQHFRGVDGDGTAVKSFIFSVQFGK